MSIVIADMRRRSQTVVVTPESRTGGLKSPLRAADRLSAGRNRHVRRRARGRVGARGTGHRRDSCGQNNHAGRRHTWPDSRLHGPSWRFLAPFDRRPTPCPARHVGRESPAQLDPDRPPPGPRLALLRAADASCPQRVCRPTRRRSHRPPPRAFRQGGRTPPFVRQQAPPSYLGEAGPTPSTIPPSQPGNVRGAAAGSGGLCAGRAAVAAANNSSAW